MFNLAAEMEIIHFSEDDKSYPSWNDATCLLNVDAKQIIKNEYSSIPE